MAVCHIAPAVAAMAVCHIAPAVAAMAVCHIAPAVAAPLLLPVRTKRYCLRYRW